MSTAPDPLDRVIGSNIRRARLKQRMSQATLARALGLSTQQVQKYETGTNRISAVRLHQVAKLLGASVGRFFRRPAGRPPPELRRGPQVTEAAPRLTKNF